MGKIKLHIKAHFYHYWTLGQVSKSPRNPEIHLLLPLAMAACYTQSLKEPLAVLELHAIGSQ